MDGKERESECSLCKSKLMCTVMLFGGENTKHGLNNILNGNPPEYSPCLPTLSFWRQNPHKLNDFYSFTHYTTHKHPKVHKQHFQFASFRIPKTFFIIIINKDVNYQNPPKLIFSALTTFQVYTGQRRSTGFAHKQHKTTNRTHTYTLSYMLHSLCNTNTDRLVCVCVKK